MEHSDSPPLAPGKAIRLANVLREKLVKDSTGYKWHLMSATVSGLDLHWNVDTDLREKCWWCVKYEAHVREGGETGGVDSLIIIVLMDGTVIVPKVSDDK